MAVKVADTIKPMSNTFPVAECIDIDVNINGETKRLQKAIDDGEIGGGSDSTWKGTKEEWEALSSEEKGKYKVVYFTDDYDSNSGGDSADNINYKNTNYPSWTNVQKALDGIMAKVDYIKPEITSFTSTAQAEYEVGQKVSSITFNWTTNKDITTQTLTDCSLADTNVRTATYTNEISSNKTFTLTIGDGQNTASKSVSITFKNRIYFGSSAIPSNFDSAFILGLSNNQFETGKNGTYTINVANNEYGFLAYPSSFGNISSVYIGGFETEVENCGTISFTNASGGTTNYNICRTKQNSLGTIKIEVK